MASNWEYLENLTFENIGNVPEDFKHEQRLVRPHGLVRNPLIKNPSLILKFYEMYIEGQPFNKREVKGTKGLLLSEILKEINPYIGMGFAIFSKGTLNIARWDDYDPKLLRNDLFAYDQHINNGNFVSIQESGAFCAWELDIVNFESRAWKRYLKSERGELDKKIYLSTIMEGRLV